MRSKLMREIAAAKEEFEAMLVETEQAGLIDEPKHNKLILETQQDRMYVMEYLFQRKQRNLTVQQFAEMFPEAYERLLEIMPRRHPEGGE